MHPNVSRRSAHPSIGVSEAKMQTPGAKERRDGARPHPEEARSAVSKDEDGPVGCALMLRDASSALPRWQRLRSRCAAMLLSMRARIEQGAFAHPTASRTNLRLHEMIAGPASVFPACSLQGRLQPKRVTTWPPAQPPHTM